MAATSSSSSGAAARLTTPSGRTLFGRCSVRQSRRCIIATVGRVPPKSTMESSKTIVAEWASLNRYQRTNSQIVPAQTTCLRKFCTVIWNRATSSWISIATWSWETSVWLACSTMSRSLHSRMSEHPTICRRSRSTTKSTMRKAIFGRLDVLFMNCAPCTHHSRP